METIQIDTFIAGLLNINTIFYIQYSRDRFDLTHAFQEPESAKA